MSRMVVIKGKTDKMIIAYLVVTYLLGFIGSFIEAMNNDLPLDESALVLRGFAFVLSPVLVPVVCVALLIILIFAIPGRIIVGLANKCSKGYW